MAISLISWNCHRYRAHLGDLKTLVNSVHPIFVGLQETMLSPLIQIKLKPYNIIQKDNIHDARPIGGVDLLYSQSFPSKIVPSNTSLQATAIQINIRTQFTLCSLYLPPKQIIRPSDLDDLVDQLPAPFIIFGDWNGHNALWGSTDTNSRGILIENFISNHNLCIFNDSRKTYFHQPSRTFQTLDLAICSPSLLPKWTFNVAEDLYNSDHFPIILTFNSNDITLPVRPSHSYIDHFIHYKRKEESKLLDFHFRNFNMYDIVFTFHGLQQALQKSHLTSPGPHEKLPPYVTGSLFVDDLQISSASVNMAFIERQLQKAVGAITKWADNNGFIFSTQKTLFVHFCKLRGLHPDPEILLYRQSIPVVPEQRFMNRPPLLTARDELKFMTWWFDALIQSGGNSKISWLVFLTNVMCHGFTATATIRGSSKISHSFCQTQKSSNC
ncbi:hypothetical protein CEXT_63641 [Caerostris extrusa]|uniref:Endonuclease/exonuclease/phosphatase domain-containing protein n=1 Tax=Caerostris extrusa TaxID=172846 RepID=A0AAV4MDT6_CAEEX|nr:hypothetical protein CEXT_63641 [Caerostris extrusa]